MVDVRSVRVRAHLVAQGIAVAVTALAWAGNPDVGRPGGDLSAIWGLLVLVAGPVAALSGTLVGLGERRLPRAPIVVLPLVAAVASAVSVFVVYALSAELASCTFPDSAVCAASRSDRVVGLLGVETALVLYAACSWIGRQVRRSWTATRAA